MKNDIDFNDPDFDEMLEKQNTNTNTDSLPKQKFLKTATRIENDSILFYYAKQVLNNESTNSCFYRFLDENNKIISFYSARNFAEDKKIKKCNFEIKFTELKLTRPDIARYIEKLENRKSRRQKTAEDFTPPKLVNEMLDKLPKDQWEENKTFCDPACGNGNFLIEVLKRKLSLNHNPTQALKTIYGTDIMLDNIREARLRLLKVIVNHVKEHKLKKPNTLELIKILGKNIVCTPLDKYANGSLDYDFEFHYTPTDLQAKQGLQKILKEKLLDTVSI